MALKVGRGAEAPPFIVMDVIAAANARAAAAAPGDPRVIRMEVGQPATGAPAPAVEAAVAAMRAGETLGYTEALGIRPLRARIARLYADRYGLVVDPARIAVTVGASGAFPLAFLAGFDRGDRIALAAPFYPPYVNILTALGLAPVILEAGPESRYQPTVAMLEALDPPPEGLIVASPCNPAGTMLHAEELAAIAAWCGAHGVRLISDEIYHGLTYGEPAATAAAVPGAVVINSFSKYWSMTGWRVGWMVLPEDLIRPVERLAQNLFISAPGISQVAALAAFDAEDELRGHLARYAANRALLLDALPKAGIDRLAPAEGAFYLYADVGHLTNDSAAFCRRMLEEIAVAATPGVDFDRARGHRTVRFSFCGATDDVAEAAERIRRWLA
ncbi:aminotransferase class I/II-fold pyridoxal phosphate-dependent enzyme [Elioraea sp.]|uniref:aminotransferase class I/II-fold pyridoxal phosphate-dependent enzyme n=1 Tax=Elioraea sp. TaxID=2185103 RepID=UPI0021DC44AC|nr:aminotransferase class I/II-fold pyridoxal phosphate-dependent enzyme [Elioraea sp.]GIX08786.1 MAG: aminotransferase [Elioraea sp.]